MNPKWKDELVRDPTGLDFISVEGYRACLGSGLCCSTGPCPIATKKYGAKWTAPCPSLKHGHGRTWCGEFLRAKSPSAKAKFAEAMGGVGSGCCMPLFNEARDLIRLHVIQEKSK